ncbi:hypothetical protein [Nocardia sp. CC227C]|uniref:hypothetical protein n=1 Tax=Nocardia sp. CC227C TaxID=3044562 RepID=UPI00278C6A18|nr:hypothetical protein [Nocardia sp. CC227C]
MTVPADVRDMLAVALTKHSLFKSHHGGFFCTSCIDHPGVGNLQEFDDFDDWVKHTAVAVLADTVLVDAICEYRAHQLNDTTEAGSHG